ncbi:hypothetical protein [Pseudofrankia sp. BMG5.37]|uniref:hypothetical protein n=1 Tax=Pseudofrankia sp. BMG5.37 TaxID=3050035 RepID=UPI0028953B26|nr:hypothetical protein [Pseudofrankia sp. BMG5.37]MDT3445087.1 hypothetical protein [Pseudofrankia sp. BMG5.37]
MNMLEQRYRAVLRLLPRAYRQAWEDDMVDTFLSGVPESDDPEFAEIARPSWPEIASVVALAVRLRLDAVRSHLGGAGASPRDLVWGDAVRLIALAGLLVHSVAATLAVANMLWLNGRIPGLAPPDFAVAFGFHTGWRDLWTSGFVWIPAFVALLLGYRRVAQGLAVVAVVPALLNAVANVSALIDSSPPVAVQVSGLAAEVLLNTASVFAVLAGFHRDAPLVRRPAWWLAAYAALFAGILGVEVTSFHGGLPLDDSFIYTLPFLTAAVVCLGGHARRSASEGPPWALALAILAPVMLATQTTTVLENDLLPLGTTRSTLMALALAKIVAILLVTGPLAFLAVRSLRRRPPAPAAPAVPSGPPATR